MYLLGIDFGSTMVKTSLVKIEEGQEVESSYSPGKGMLISTPTPGWAEQHPSVWWNNICKAIREVVDFSGVSPSMIKAIGISYQMHGLVMVDENLEVIYPSILWCDSRSVDIGRHALDALGREYCFSSLLNSPGNFTASKLRWIKENQPEIYRKIHKIMLPGDYIAMKMTGQIQTTIAGLSEAILWDFNQGDISGEVLDYYGIDRSFIPELVENFTFQAALSPAAADELSLKPGIPITYRAGDQTNSAFALKVLNAGELFTQVGTSGTMLTLTDQYKADYTSRVNTFAHVNHTSQNPRLAILLCTNGTGIMKKWLNGQIIQNSLNLEEIRRLESELPVGSEGLMVFPFGNGSERMLNDLNPKASMLGLDMNKHTLHHISRATSEGIAFALNYGLEIIRSVQPDNHVIKAYKSKIFGSKVFRDALSTVSDSKIEFYNNEGAKGAALAAGIGLGVYKDIDDAFRDLSLVDEIFPDSKDAASYKKAYHNWKEVLLHHILS